jgi:hypothetical protein
LFNCTVFWTIWKKEGKGKFQIYLDPNLQPYVDVFSPITLENIAARGEMAAKKSGALLPSLQNASGIFVYKGSPESSPTTSKFGGTHIGAKLYPFWLRIPSRHRSPRISV